jgi:oxygen-dependent protoporphyrinogen oxidase
MSICQINLLRLQDEIVKVSKAAPAATGRFLYIPQSYGENAAGLQMMPSISSLRSSPLLFEILSSVIREPFRRSNRPENISDESVNSFLSRRFGDMFASKFGSALVHGIYAADSSQISVKAAFPSLWRAEETGRGSVVRGFLASLFRKQESEPYELGCVQDSMRDVAVFSFKDGMATLTSSLENYLQNLPNVTILRGTEVQTIEPLKNQTIKVNIFTS